MEPLPLWRLGSENLNVLPNLPSLAPYQYGPGVAFTPLHEMLLHSLGDVIRAMPAITDDWQARCYP